MKFSSSTRWLLLIFHEKNVFHLEEGNVLPNFYPNNHILLVQWLWEMTHVREVRISNPGTIYMRDMTFFTLFCCEKCIVCLKRPKITDKEAVVCPFFIIMSYFVRMYLMYFLMYAVCELNNSVNMFEFSHVLQPSKYLTKGFKQLVPLLVCFLFAFSVINHVLTALNLRHSQCAVSYLALRIDPE